jgi:hypothetical protein
LDWFKALREFKELKEIQAQEIDRLMMAKWKLDDVIKIVNSSGLLTKSEKEEIREKILGIIEHFLIKVSLLR